MAKPRAYTKKIADEVCDRLAGGESLNSICRDEHIPDRRTVMRWLFRDDMDEFRKMYDRARRSQAELWADELNDIADDGRNDWMERQNRDGSTTMVVDHENIQRSKLRVDTRKWIASKMLPKVYGDRLAVGGDSENPIIPAEALTWIREAISRRKG